MLRYLTEWLTQYYTGFNAFSYLTLRAIMAALTALSISFDPREKPAQARAADSSRPTPCPP